jgi:bile acid:Na+ symporter, BASS family
VSSNLFTFLAHGAVALAVSLTFIHTLLSPLLTPAIAAAFAGKYVSVDFWALAKQMAEMVLLPLCLGLAGRRVLGERRLAAAGPVLPMVSALLLYGVALGLVAAAAPAIRRNLDWVPVIAATTSVLTAVNLAVAYVLAKALRLPEAEARAITFDVGVYNSGLGAVLAGLNFGPLAALPALMNSVLNMIIGSLLASWLHARPVPGAVEREEPAVRLMEPAARGGGPA